MIWVVGDGYEAGGYVLKSTDGGNHWAIKHHDTDFFYEDIDVLNNNVIWISGADNVTGDGGFIWKCTNDGTNLADSSCVYGWYGDVDAVGDTTVWAVGGTYFSDGKNFVKKSKDGGNTWKNKLTWDAYSVPGKNHTAVNALNKSSCWVVGHSGFIRFTIDGGGRWQHQPSPTQNNLLDVDACDYNHAWAVGEGGVAIRYVQP